MSQTDRSHLAPRFLMQRNMGKQCPRALQIFSCMSWGNGLNKGEYSCISPTQCRMRKTRFPGKWLVVFFTVTKWKWNNFLHLYLQELNWSNNILFHIFIINKDTVFNIEQLVTAANKSLQRYMFKLQMIVFSRPQSLNNNDSYEMTFFFLMYSVEYSGELI